MIAEEKLSAIWRELGQKYVAAINSFVERGETLGWEVAGEQPRDDRESYAEAVLEFVRRANERREFTGLRDRFPPAHEPFLSKMKENEQFVGPVILLTDGRILVRVGAPYESGCVYLLNGDHVEEIPEVISFGLSANRRYIAIAKPSGVEMREGWEGAAVAHFQWPTGNEDLPGDCTGFGMPEVPPVTQLIPFSDGERVLLVSSYGIYVLREDGASRLHPTIQTLREHEKWAREEAPDQLGKCRLSMEHGAVSAADQWIAVGDQCSSHLLYNNRLQLAGEVGHLSEYPHFAVFDAEGKHVALNSCHFYNGATIIVPTALLPGLRTAAYEPDSRFAQAQDNDARVYAAVYRQGEFIVGDAYGYLRAYDVQGKFRWQHYVGGTISGLDISPDGKRLAVSTYAGYLCVLCLDTGKRDPFAIGTSTHQEIRRWLFWKKEAQPLIW